LHRAEGFAESLRTHLEGNGPPDCGLLFAAMAERAGMRLRVL
jgi:hypothetical protein